MITFVRKVLWMCSDQWKNQVYTGVDKGGMFSSLAIWMVNCC